MNNEPLQYFIWQDLQKNKWKFELYKNKLELYLLSSGLQILQSRTKESDLSVNNTVAEIYNNLLEYHINKKDIVLSTE
jgi:hypothetical protein